MRKNMTLLLVLLVFASLLSACGPTTVYSQGEPPLRTITVTGTGMVTMTPDIAYIYLGVQTQDSSASTAMQENNTRAAALIEAVKSFGVEAADIQTTNFSIYPQNIYDGDNNVIGTTYIVQNVVYVTVRNLDTLGELLDGAFQAGANTINSISFDVADRTEAVSQARLAAVEDALRQAQELTGATQVTLGEVQTISYYDSTPYPVYYETRAMMDAGSSVPIEAGSMQITTTVTIVYEIR